MKGASALALLQARMLKHWLSLLGNMTESALDITAAWHWLAFAVPAEFMKCAEDVTPGPYPLYKRALMLTRDVLTWHKMHCGISSGLFPLAWDTRAHRYLVTHAEIEVSFDFCFEARHYALLTLFTQVRIFSACHKCILILPARPSDLRLKSLIAKCFLLTSLTTK